MKKNVCCLFLVVIMCVPAFSTLHAGVIIVTNDEWTVSDTGFTNAREDTEYFVRNIADLFAPDGSGAFHAYSDFFCYQGVRLGQTLVSLGHTYSVGTDFEFTTENIGQFNGLFFAAHYLNSDEIDVLKDYVHHGGSVYIAGGTRFGGAEREAQAWNAFLEDFGLEFVPRYNDIHGNIDVSASDSPLFANVTELYQNNGSSITGAGVLVSHDGEGLYAMVDVNPVPIPSALFLLGGGLVCLAAFRIVFNRKSVQ